LRGASEGWRRGEGKRGEEGERSEGVKG